MSNPQNIEEGKQRILAIIADAKPFPPLEEAWPHFSKSPARKTARDTKKTEVKKGGGAQTRKRVPQRDSLLSLLGNVEFWHDPNSDAYATFTTKGHRENRAVRSREFKLHLSRLFSNAHGSTLGGQALEDSLRGLEARAVHDGPEYQTWCRVGQIGETLYLDLGDPRWRCVEIKSTGWRVLDDAPIKFLRSRAMRSLPEPEPGGLVEQLRQFVNLATDEDFVLLVGFLVATLRVGVPFPILILIGEQGSGKSVLCRLLRQLLDPNDAPIRAVPREERDLLVSAVNSHMLVFDNLSGVPSWLSDGLCRIATGSGFATRKLHTDREEEVFSASRPIILNGIASLSDRADLADRAVVLHLPTIGEDARQNEDQFWSEFDAALPEILGSLLDAVVAGLKHLPTTRLERSPRMADFARWCTACEPGLGRLNVNLGPDRLGKGLQVKAIVEFLE